MKSFLYWLFHQKKEINYLYFSFFLGFLILLSFSLFLNAEEPISGVPLFFLLYAIGQAFLEVCFFILIAYVLKRWGTRLFYLVFISLSFIFLLLHFTNFTMVRLLDVTIVYIFKFLFGSGIGHLVTGFQALNLNGTMTALIIGGIFFVPALGLGFYWLTSRASRKLKPMHISLKQIAISFASVSIALFLLDLVAHSYLTRRAYDRYQKTLPLGTTFLVPDVPQLTLPNAFPPIRNENETLRLIPDIEPLQKPNIYFFIVETFRRDFVNQETAPYLTRFGKENITSDATYANANASQISWFTLFHADIPFYWASMRDEWKGGSIPLQFLKKMGYKIRVKTAADLRYFSMDKLIFGQNKELVDNFEEYGTHPAHVRDNMALKSLLKDIKTAEGKKGNVYLVFLDSTHSEYSFPDEYELKFEPIAKEIDYLTIGPKSPELEYIKNRYRNAIHYVDDLFGLFFDALKSEHLMDESVISITGDHGEEFFEERALFHGTHLNRYQTHVPILLKFGTTKWSPKVNQITHIDLFPSILHYLTGVNDFSALFDGESIFNANHWPYRIAVLQNGPDTPCEFLISDEKTCLHARFLDDSNMEVLQLEGSIQPNLFSPFIHK